MIALFRDDQANDAVLYRFEVSPRHMFYVKISKTAYTMSGGQPEGRIREWFLNKPLPPHGSTVDIPSYQFDPTFF